MPTNEIILSIDLGELLTTYRMRKRRVATRKGDWTQQYVATRCGVDEATYRAWAMNLGPDLHGVWGGTSSVQRKRARVAGLDLHDILEAVDTRKPTWETAPCRGCVGNLSRSDLERDDGWCWACRPAESCIPLEMTR